MLNILFFVLFAGVAGFICLKIWNSINEKLGDEPSLAPDAEDDGTEEPDPLNIDTDIGEEDGEADDQENPPV